MTDSTKSYIIATIRELFLAVFTPEEVRWSVRTALSSNPLWLDLAPATAWTAWWMR